MARQYPPSRLGVVDPFSSLTMKVTLAFDGSAAAEAAFQMLRTLVCPEVCPVLHHPCPLFIGVPLERRWSSLQHTGQHMNMPNRVVLMFLSEAAHTLCVPAHVVNMTHSLPCGSSLHSAVMVVVVYAFAAMCAWRLGFSSIK